MKTIKCDISEVTLLEDNVLFIDIQQEKEFELKDFNQLKVAAERLGKGKKFFNIIKVGYLTNPNDESMEASCSPEGSQYKYADAFVIQSLAQKIIANVYLKIKKPTVPTKFFNNIEAAHKWIEELKISISFDEQSYHAVDHCNIAYGS